MAETNSGTSVGITIAGQQLKQLLQKGGLLKISKVDYRGCAKPPEPNKDTTPSEAMSYVNKFRDFAFQKITQPDYGNPDNGFTQHDLSVITGFPANEPDFIADFHFISLMRIVDDLMQHKYKGTIQGEYNSVNSK